MNVTLEDRKRERRGRTMEKEKERVEAGLITELQVRKDTSLQKRKVKIIFTCVFFCQR